MTAVIAAGVAAFVGTPLTLWATRWAQAAPQRLMRLTALAVVLGVGVALAVTAGVLVACYGVALTAAAAPALLLAAAAALTDVREGRLPNVLTGPLLAVTLVTVLTATAVHGDLGAAARAGAGGAGAMAMMVIAKLTRPEAMGWGDIKFAPSLAAPLAAVSWSTLYVGVLSWWVLIAVLAGLGLLTGVLRRRDPMPFGPAMLLGTALALTAATPVPPA